MEEISEKEVIANIRACLVSKKGRCELPNLNKDYKLLMGSNIPFKRLGYTSLEQFLGTIPTLSLSTINGQLTVDAKANEKSSHISALVNRQKTKTRKPSSSYKTSRSAGYARPKWQPKSSKRNYQNSPRPNAVKHNQFINNPEPSPPRQSTISSKLASRLGPKIPVNRTNSVPLMPKSDEIDRVFTKTKERLTKRIESIDINGSHGFRSDEYITHDNKLNESSFRYFTDTDSKSNTTPTTPVTNVEHAPWWTNTVNTQSNSEFITNSVQVPTFIATGNHLVDLKAFTSINKLGDPQIKVMVRKNKSDKRTCYDCHIKVHTHSYSSYPNDYYNELHAQQETAKEALEELMLLYNRRKSLLISNDVDVLERIPPIVQSHYSGIWKDQLEADYSELFTEQLPVNWLEIVDTLPNISVTPSFDKFILRSCKPGEGFQKGLNNSTPFVSNISVPTASTTFDNNGRLIAEITCPLSAFEIWCKQIDTSASSKFESMMKEFVLYCSDRKNLNSLETVDNGGYYIAYNELDRTWYRIRVFDKEENSVHCFCIDYGDELILQMSELYALPRQFAREPAQAFVCRLAGLEDFYEASKSSECIKSLDGKIVFVYLQKQDTVEDEMLDVILVDVEEDITINEQLLDILESAMYIAPDLIEDTPTEVFVTNSEDSGVVYVHIPYTGSKQLFTMLEDLQSQVKKNEINMPKHKIMKTDRKDQLYYMESNGYWYRTKVLEWAPRDNYAQIQFIDHGSTTVVNVEQHSVYYLEELNETAAKFSEQAKPAKFALDNKIPKHFGELIRRLIREDQPVLAKIVGWDADGLPLLKFFKRSEPDQLLFSINDAIASENEIGSMNGKTHSTKLEKLQFLHQADDLRVPSAGFLPSPMIPKPGEYFDVIVPCAVNPYNFFVQPYDSRKELYELMTDLQEKCKDILHSPLSVHDIIPGKVYASKYSETGSWYRTSITKVINPGSISVFYCDFGYYATVSLQQLVPLDDSFLQLPYQAIKAKLAGIQPKHSKWSMDDCKFFQKAVCKKYFVSVIVDIEKDTYYRSDTVLSLKLVDTSTTNDIYIHQILINEGIAIAH